MDRYVKKAIRDLYRKQVDPKREADPALFEGILRNFNKAVDASVNSKKHGGFAHELRTNNEVYSAFRSHRMGRDMAAKMLDEDGKLKSFTKFREDVKPIADHHVKHWLETEYNTAVRRAHLAEKWKTYEDDKDNFPNLRWVESWAVQKDKEHFDFRNTIAPVNDPFWDAHRPGDRWGCKCGLEQTDEETNIPASAGGKGGDPSPGLEENPAKTKRLFSDKGPFFPTSCASCPFASMLQAAKETDLTASRKKDCYNCSAAKKVVEKAQETKPMSKTAMLRHKYMKEMEVLLDKKVVLNADGQDITVSFNQKGNEHLYSDTFKRSKVLKKEDLKHLDKTLAESKYVDQAKLSKTRGDKIRHFYYYKAKIRDKVVYLNIAETEHINKKGKIKHDRFLYSVTDKIRKQKE